MNLSSPENVERPDVIVILVDDMGFSDFGCTGSEIRTPNIDSIATNGRMLTSMYNSARCCPTRASLLTGMYPHNAGVGQMGANLGTPAYQGFLRDDVMTIAEIMQLNGYRTLMSGKWHVAGDLWATRVDSWRIGAEGHPTPRQRGFDRFYGIVDGVSSFFSPHYMMRDDVRIDVSPDNFYMTDAVTDEAIKMIDEPKGDTKPYFMYLAYTAPHWPLHAHEEDIALYRGMYAGGWDNVRTSRHEELNSRGVLEKPWDISPRDENAKPWREVTNKDWEAERMAVYAAMIHRLDFNVGRLLSHLRSKGSLDNTLIMFLSDNGGCAELMQEDGWCKYFPNINNDGSRVLMGNRDDVVPGSATTYMSYDLPWANVSNAPFRKFKHYVHEGGISTPLLIQWPRKIPAGSTVHHATHVSDILPTILDATGAHRPSSHHGRDMLPLDGESFLPLIFGQTWSRNSPIFFEHEGNAAVRMGDFKLVREYGKDWELYQIIEDRTELHDLAQGDQKRIAGMTAIYEEWAQKTGVLDWGLLLPKLQKIWEMSDIAQT